MIGRADGQVVLVSGAIPGERVTARIERVGKGMAFAEALTIDEPSPDRETAGGDPLCGGCLYRHIAYSRQIALKGEVIADALGRIGRIVWPAPILVAASPVEGYRMRARLHLRRGRIGFFREGSHEICDARGTKQLLSSTCDVLDRLTGASTATPDSEVELSENVDASERVVHVETPGGLVHQALRGLVEAGVLTGGTVGRGTPATTSTASIVAGAPYVSDALTIADRPVRLRRHVLSFFQGNRFLLQALVSRVSETIRPSDEVIDLYAGAGLFAMAAVARGATVTAVEGDQMSVSDLQWNARSCEGAVTAVHQSVEEFTAIRRRAPAVLIVDPPRSGMSKRALQGALALGAGRIVYVSCDVATAARDARQLLDAGYEIRRIDAFDLFPNTPHVETVIQLERQS